MLGSFLIPYILPKWVEGRVSLITSLFLLAISTLFIGPFFAQTNLASMVAGLAFSGFFMSFLSIPNLPEMMIACQEAYPKSDQMHANSLLSGMLNACCGIGQATGPLLGAFLFETTDFRMTMIVESVLTAGYALVYLLCAQGCEAYAQTCRNFRNRH